MSNLIVKDNVLVQASHRLGEAEQRLILLAILQARKNSVSIDDLTGKELSIHADDYIDNFGGTRQNAYINLRKAVMGLFYAKWGYKHLNDKGNLVVSHRRFTQTADYIENEATVKFMFADAIVPFLCELKSKFTQYEIKQVANLSSAYAFRLYEYFLSFLHKNSNFAYCEVSLDDLRFTLGLLQNEYKTMSDFKKRVFDASIKQINDNTDISVSYTQKKQGRTIMGFVFELKRKKSAVKTTVDIDDLFAKSNMTSSEIDTVKEQVQKTIDKNNITSDYHIKNLYKKAIKERWGLDNDCPPPVSAEEVEKRKKAQKEHEEKLQKEQQEFDRLVSLYQNSDDDFKNAVDNAVKKRLQENKEGMVVYFENQLKINKTYYKDRHLQADFIFVMSQMEQGNE